MVPVPEVRHRQTDRETDRQTLYWVNTALCIASRIRAGKRNRYIMNSNSWYVGVVKRLSIRLRDSRPIYSRRHRLGSKQDRGFYKLRLTPSVFYPHSGVFPLHQTAPVAVSESRDPKLFGRAIIFEVFQPMWKSHRRTDDVQSHNRAVRSIAR